MKNVILLFNFIHTPRYIILAVILTKKGKDRYRIVLNTLTFKKFKKSTYTSTTKSIFNLKSEKKMLFIRFM